MSALIRDNALMVMMMMVRRRMMVMMMVMMFTPAMMIVMILNNDDAPQIKGSRECRSVRESPMWMGFIR